MKRLISLLLVLTVVLGLPLAACAADDFSVGVTEGQRYWNDTVGVGCTLGDEWYFYTEEEIAAQNGLAAGMLREDYAKMVAESGSMMDMLALNTETGTSVNVTLQRLSLTDALLINEQKYAEISTESLTEALEQIGLENVGTSVDKVEFLGEKHPCVRVTGVMQGVDFFETLAIFKTGRTVCIVTVGCFQEDTSAEVLACFYGEKP